jgi:hypothetical protein
MSRNIPEGVWIREFNIDENDKIIIEGMAYDERKIIGFSKSFDSSQNLKDINIANLKSINNANGALIKEFKIVAKLKKNERE